jgi:hypothetical protein
MYVCVYVCMYVCKTWGEAQCLKHIGVISFNIRGFYILTTKSISVFLMDYGFQNKQLLFHSRALADYFI